MKIRLNEDLEKKVVEITGVDYTGELELEDIENLIEDLIYNYHILEEKLEEEEGDERDEFKEWRDNNATR